MPECRLLKNHMCATVSGNWRPCCKFDETLLPWDKKFRIEKFTFQEWRNSDFYQDIIQQQKNGWHKGCEGCRVAEETNNPSMRETFGQYLSGEGTDIEFIELSLSRECNLACRMCGPYASSTWQNIVVDNQELIKPFFRPQLDQTPVDIERFFQGLNLSKINRIKLLGGEPFITPQTKDFFEFLDKQNLLENITFMTNTNATFFPKKLEKYLERLEYLHISISIDGFGKNNDYVRHKSKWENVLEVIEQWGEFTARNNKKRGERVFKLSPAVCVNAYNVHQIDEIFEWSIREEFYSQNYNIIFNPSHLKLEALPPRYVQEVLEKLEKSSAPIFGVKKYLKTMQHDPEKLEQLKDYTNKMDKITGIKLQDYNPSLARHLEI